MQKKESVLSFYIREEKMICDFELVFMEIKAVAGSGKVRPLQGGGHKLSREGEAGS